MAAQAHRSSRPLQAIFDFFHWGQEPHRETEQVGKTYSPKPESGYSEPTVVLHVAADANAQRAYDLLKQGNFAFRVVPSDAESATHLEWLDHSTSDMEKIERFVERHSSLMDGIAATVNTAAPFKSDDDRELARERRQNRLDQLREQNDQVVKRMLA